ncbi:hypothetical protein BZU93_26215 [Salmonella enterica subsp. enterica]|nr:hypothetical protein [Salmonella enterica subsp. enterica]EBW2353234.1 hypothetical protein [Salmonella enterica subsp. enterica serovar Enteritidis]ECI7685843.1 hypothetical protein [Salmonella enterica subsp. enterica serovar Paratyphi A]EFG6100905.1 hypothetical protein [Escherichia coli]EFG8200177.1 hypothetical protein [Escherichia coli]
MRDALTRGVMLACLLALAGPAAAEGDALSLMLSDEDQTIAYTPCAPNEEAGECLVHILTCNPSDAYGSGLELLVIGQGGDASGKPDPDILAMARSQLEKPYGEARLHFSVGGKPVEIPASAVLVSSNELNGDWDLAVRSMDPGAFYDALTADSAGAVSADLGGHAVSLAASKADGAALLKFKTACTR